MADLSLSIGDVVLQGVEIPETLNPLGTKQSHVVHEFPGGLKTIRNLGAFPIAFTWSGIMSGPSAFDRKIAIERMAATAQLVVFTYGPFSLRGEVIRFEAHPRHQFYIPYTIHFEPLEDLSGLTQGQQSSTSPESQLATQQDTMGAQQSGAGTTMTPYDPTQNANAFTKATNGADAVQLSAEDAAAQENAIYAADLAAEGQVDGLPQYQIAP